jgi:hypothetical protein
MLRSAVAVAAVLVLAAGCGGANTTAGSAITEAPTTGASTGGPSPTTAAPATVTIAGVGDILMGTAPDRLPPSNGKGFFDRVAQQLAADLTMGNLETPLSEPTGHVKCAPPPTTTPPPSGEPAAPAKPSGCFAFRLPPSYATVLRDGGFDVVTLANNHTNDAGPAGLRNTRTALTAAGVKPTGGPEEIAVHEVNGISVAVLGFGPYSWMQSVLDIEAAVELVRTADQDADLVVVNMHAGGEGADRQHVKPGVERFLGENRGDPMGFARAVVDAGADLVVGHSPHVLRGMEFHKGRLIAYSTGNFAGYRVLSASGPLGTGVIVRATLTKDGTWVGGSLVPTAMVDGGFPAVDPKKSALTQIRDLSAADLPATAVTVADDGTLGPPAR